MFRTTADFLNDLKNENAATLKIFKAISPEGLEQRAFEHGKTIRELAWHITTALGGIPAQLGLPVETPGFGSPVPEDFNEISDVYAKTARSVAEQVEKGFNDGMLLDEVPIWGMSLPRGSVLSGLLRHEAHHRGQLTALMRIAGMRVPGIYGPAYEETMQMQAATAAEA